MRWKSLILAPCFIKKSIIRLVLVATSLMLLTALSYFGPLARYCQSTEMKLQSWLRSSSTISHNHQRFELITPVDWHTIFHENCFGISAVFIESMDVDFRRCPKVKFGIVYVFFVVYCQFVSNHSIPSENVHFKLVLMSDWKNNLTNY